MLYPIHYKILGYCWGNCHESTIIHPKNKHEIALHPHCDAKLLKPAVPNDNERFPNREATYFYDFGDDPEREWLVDSIVNHKTRLISIYYGTLAKLHANRSHTARILPHSITTSNYMESRDGVTSREHKNTVTEKLRA